MSDVLTVDTRAESPSMASVQTAKPGNERMIQLDILRGIAIILVLFHHHIILPNQAGIFSRLAIPLHMGGWSGVDLFFILSGFLIGGLLFAELKARQTIDIKRFLVRRAFKIWPGYLLLLCFLVFMKAMHWDFYMFDKNKIASIGAIIPGFFHVQNYLGTPRVHTWSLAVEEHFYIALPFLLVYLGARRTRPSPFAVIPWIAVGLSTACLLGRIHARHTAHWHLARNLYPTHLRIDSLFCGVTLAYLYHLRPDLLGRVGRRTGPLILAGLALIAPVFIYSNYVYPWVVEWGYTMLAVGYGCLLVAFVYSEPRVGWMGKFLTSGVARALAFVGAFSYQIYLWHIDIGKEPLGYWVRHGLFAEMSPSLRWIVVMAIYFTLAITMGVVMHKLIEKPSLLLRDKLFPSLVTNRQVLRHPRGFEGPDGVPVTLAESPHAQATPAAAEA